MKANTRWTQHSGKCHFPRNVEFQIDTLAPSQQTTPDQIRRVQRKKIDRFKKLRFPEQMDLRPPAGSRMWSKKPNVCADAQCWSGAILKIICLLQELFLFKRVVIGKGSTFGLLCYSAATIGFSMITCVGGNNLSPNEHIYPEHVTKEDARSTYSFGPNPVSFPPPRRCFRVYSVTLRQKSALRVM